MINIYSLYTIYIYIYILNNVARLVRKKIGQQRMQRAKKIFSPATLGTRVIGLSALA
jgi:hypothetical protein